MEEKAKEILLSLSKDLEVKARELGSLLHGQSPSAASSTSGSSSGQVHDILHRAKKLGKQLRQPKKPVAESNLVMISVCRMKNYRKKMQSTLPAMELEVDRDDSYTAEALGMSEKAGYTLMLFKMNGSTIPNSRLTVRDMRREWTLGNYLLATKRSPAQTKLGVGFLSDKCFDSSSDDEITSVKRFKESSSESESQFRHKKAIKGKGEVGLKGKGTEGQKKPVTSQVSQMHVKPIYGYLSPKGVMSHEVLERKEVWRKLGNTARGIDRDPFHPECVGYTIVKVTIGDVTVLDSNLEDTYVTSYSAKPTATSSMIIYESPSDIVVQNFSSAIPLCCISSQHGKCTYHWRKLGEPNVEFPQTPVLFVKHVGLYQCTVACEGGDEEDSHIFSVSVIPGPSVPDLILVEDAVCDDTFSSSVVSDEFGKDNLGGEELKSSTAGVQIAVKQRVPAQCMRVGGGILELSVEDLEVTTDNFAGSRMIGKGGFGVVYKGVLNACAVAIKVLSEEGCRSLTSPNKSLASAVGSVSQQLKSEVQALTKYHHPNLVQLMGFCSAISRPALVLEYMENGSLHNHLHSQTCVTLTWNQRARILKDTCRGLAWLHGSHPPLVHQDVKLANILLDGQFRGKLSDFGFAIEMPTVVQGRTLVTAAMIAKTEGYFPPELNEGRYSHKSDVYSYGVVVLEAFTAQLAYNPKREEDRKLTDYAESYLRTSQTLSEISDPKAGPIAPYLMLLFHKIVNLCIQKHSKRLTSAEVMKLWNETNF